MRTAPVVLALLVASALAGCTGGNSEGRTNDDALSRSGTPTGDGDANRTSTPSPQGSRADRSVDATLNASVANGTAPLNVTFSFDASTDDPNGTASLTWTLEVWRESLPANATPPAGNGTGNGTENETEDDD